MQYIQTFILMYYLIILNIGVIILNIGVYGGARWCNCTSWNLLKLYFNKYKFTLINIMKTLLHIITDNIWYFWSYYKYGPWLKPAHSALRYHLYYSLWSIPKYYNTVIHYKKYYKILLNIIIHNNSYIQ